MFRANFLELFFAFTIGACCVRTQNDFRMPRKNIGKNNGHNTKKTADFLCHQICSYYFCDNNLYYIVIN